MVDFETLVPPQCRDCTVLHGMIRKKETLLGQIANLLEADMNEGQAVDLGEVITKMAAYEEEAQQEVVVFVNRCKDTTSHLPHGNSEGELSIDCRMPPADWDGAF